MNQANPTKEPVREKSALLETAVSPGGNLLTRPLAAFILLSFLAALIYSNTFTVSFQFDDIQNIVENPRIKNLADSFDLSDSRYVGFLTFALNHYFGGLNVFGYHLVNLLIHLTNGFLVYALVLLLFKAVSGLQPGRAREPTPTDHGGNESRPHPSLIALATALLFIAHPLQTEAVTYIVQRFASLAALFYLLAVVCYLKWRLNSWEDRSRYFWYVGALLSTILAMKTKENSFTLPFMLWLIEGVLFRLFSRKQFFALTPFLLTLLIIPLSRMDAVVEAEAGFAQQTTGISRLDYLLTQFRVIVTYIRLILLPISQNLDYDYPIHHSLFELPVFFSFLFLLSLFGLAGHLLLNSKLRTQNSRLIGFGILWFFLTLSIESSIIPIRDVIFEHRLYLPSAGFLLSLTITSVCGINFLSAQGRLPQRASQKLFSRSIIRISSFLLILFILSLATYQRNLVWKDELTLWKDVVDKAPGKTGPHNNLGLAYYKLPGHFEEAIKEYQIALIIEPDNSQAHTNLGAAYQSMGRLKEAMDEYQTVLKLQPQNAEAHYNLGVVYEDMGRPAESIREYQTALKLKPDYAAAHSNLGTLYGNLGRLDDAIQEFQIALKLDPDIAEIHYNLGNAYLLKGRIPDASRAFERALQVQPVFPAARKAIESLP